tara:strand:- start:1318 stop:1560 length:243 start_codon:yes stop_codon:yes gene_type:complete
MVTLWLPKQNPMSHACLPAAVSLPLSITPHTWTIGKGERILHQGQQAIWLLYSGKKKREESILLFWLIDGDRQKNVHDNW